MTAVMTMTEDTFDTDLANSPTPVLVDFWAEGCGPCKALAPHLEDLAHDTAGRLRIAEVRLDDNPGLATRYEIMALPTLIVFVDGQPVKRLINIGSRQGLTEQLTEYLA